MEFSDLKKGNVLYYDYGNSSEKYYYYIKVINDNSATAIMFFFDIRKKELRIEENDYITNEHFKDKYFIYSDLSFIESDKLIKRIFSKDWKITKE
jgi:hypothetical protein